MINNAFSSLYKKDEKLKLLKRLERNFVFSEEGKKSENSSHESMDEDTQGKEDLFYFPWYIN